MKQLSLMQPHTLYIQQRVYTRPRSPYSPSLDGHMDKVSYRKSSKGQPRTRVKNTSKCKSDGIFALVLIKFYLHPCYHILNHLIFTIQVFIQFLFFTINLHEIQIGGGVRLPGYQVSNMIEWGQESTHLLCSFSLFIGWAKHITSFIKSQTIESMTILDSTFKHNVSSIPSS